MLVSIQLMSPASGDLADTYSIQDGRKLVRFHSINVPSEWGLHNSSQETSHETSIVSIQLMSPASGDYSTKFCLPCPRNWVVSIQLMSPASGDLNENIPI